MSWSYYDTGLASAVQKRAGERLRQAAENCKNIPSEKKSIESLHGAVYAVCEEAEGQAVRVNASGSAWLENGKLRSFTYEAKIEVFDLSERE